MNQVIAFCAVPAFARGLVRDVRVRWALEEAGLPYQTRLIGPDDQTSKAYRALQPFGQVPVLEEDGFSLFESGAIVLHIAERSEALMPADAKGRARMTAWMFAALNSIEPHIMNFVTLEVFHASAEWAKHRRPALQQIALTRLSALAEWLDGRDYLENRFTAADLLMTTVLRVADRSGLLATLPTLDAYRLRCEARLAFKKALASHLAECTEMTAPAALLPAPG